MFFRKRKLAQKIENDWATQAADAIENVIDMIRDKAVVPLMTIARGIVYGTLVGVLCICIAVLLSILLIRFLDIYLHNLSWMPDGVWIIDAIVGGIFVIAGLVVWSKRKVKTTTAE